MCVFCFEKLKPTQRKIVVVFKQQFQRNEFFRKMSVKSECERQQPQNNVLTWYLHTRLCCFHHRLWNSLAIHLGDTLLLHHTPMPNIQLTSTFSTNAVLISSCHRHGIRMMSNSPNIKLSKSSSVNLMLTKLMASSWFRWDLQGNLSPNELWMSETCNQIKLRSWFYEHKFVRSTQFSSEMTMKQCYICTVWVPIWHNENEVIPLNTFTRTRW